MYAFRLLMIGTIVTGLNMPAAKAGPLVGGGLGITLGGGGEFDEGRGVDSDHQDMGGTSYNAFLLIPIADVMRVGSVLQLTPNRSVRVEHGPPGRTDESSVGGRRDFGKVLTLNAIVEYDVFKAPQNEYSVHVAAGGGMLACMPKHEVGEILEQRQDDGTKLGYNFGLGIGGTRIMEGNVGLRADISVTYETIALVNTTDLEMTFNTLRYLLSLGIVLEL